ncbi:MAG: hypothetical protein EBY07_15375, partial [Actinobacteria bacterium]|nr:hypothetical protein [Actinomycetota bacterium]
MQNLKPELRIMNSFLTKMIMRSSFKNLSRLMDSFSRSASMSGWPEDVIENIDLQLDEADISLAYDPNLQDSISELEYGNVNKPAKAAIR